MGMNERCAWDPWRMDEIISLTAPEALPNYAHCMSSLAGLINLTTSASHSTTSNAPAPTRYPSDDGRVLKSRKQNLRQNYKNFNHKTLL
jgi:hypothetical protein